MTRRRAEPRCLAFAFAAWAALSHAQVGGGVTVQSRVSLMQTWTDNLRLDDANKDAALITTVSPGVSIASNSGSLRGTLDYSLNGIAYFKTNQPSRVQHALSANARAEVVPRTFFVDLRASIGQQSRSAFGQQSVPTLGSQGAVANLANTNQQETATASVAPSLRGMLGGLASYDMRGDFTLTEVRGSSLGDSRAAGVSLRMDELNAGVLAWWAMATSRQTKSSGVPSNRNDAVRLGLNYNPDPDWHLSVHVGQERNDYLGGNSRSGVTSGAAAHWSPTPRTRLNADWQKHNYGNSHTLSFEHRLSRSVWRIADTQSTALGNVGPNGGVRTLYDEFYLLFTSVEPDPVKRDTLVRAYLQSQGLSPDTPASGGFLSAGPSRLRTQLLSITLQSSRQTLSAQFTRSLTSRLGNNINQGDLADSSRIEQRSFSLTASHQLTPTSGISLSATRQQNAGDLRSQANRLSSLMVNWNARLGLRLSLLLGARHSRFEGARPYTENGAYGTLTQTF